MTAGVGVGVGFAGDLDSPPTPEGTDGNANDIPRILRRPALPVRPPLRATSARIEALADQCGERDTAILWTLNRLRLATGYQLERLHFDGIAGRSRSVSRWRVLKRLADRGLITPLARRIGGSKRGSAGMVYALDSAGARLLRFGQGDAKRVRRPTPPGERKVKHTLAVSELYAEMMELSRVHGFELLRFDVEPSYPTGTGWLTPDAYAVVSAAGITDHWWIEVDRATESATTVRRKLEAYRAFYEQGHWSALGVMPRVLVTVPNGSREAAIREAFKNSIAELTTICQQEAAVPHVVHTLANMHLPMT